MIRRGCFLAVFAGWLLIAQFSAGEPQPGKDVIDVHGPTIVALFASATTTEPENEVDTDEALSDFQFYSGRVREPLRKSGIQFLELHERSFRIRIAQEIQVFKVGKAGVAYYLFTPGKKPRIESGVMTDVDLLQFANEYFGTSIR